MLFKQLLWAAVFITIIWYSHAWPGEMETYIPNKAYAVMPIIAEEAKHYGIPFDVSFITAAVEQESCISLRHSKCFSSAVHFKTKWKNGKPREEGAGIMMLTRTWRSNGEIRFDTLTRLTKKYKSHLKGLNWSSVYRSKRLSVRAGIFLMLDDWISLEKKGVPECERPPMLISAYNQGMGGVNQDRRICGLTKGCDPDIWFGNVEKVKRPWFSTRVLYSRRTAWDINRTHVKNVFNRRLPKYRKYYSQFY